MNFSIHREHSLIQFFSLFVYLIFQVALLPQTFAKEKDFPLPIKIGSYLTPGLIKEDGTGLFNQLNHAIFTEMKQNSDLTLSSINRARKGIKDGTLDGYFPELWENLSGEKSQYIVSNPIFYKRIILFTLRDSEEFELSGFKDKLLGAVKGYSYGSDIKSNPDLNITYQDNDIVNIRLLLNKRISGVLGGFPGTVNAVKNSLSANKIHYDLDKPVAILESFYVCKKDVEGIKLCGAINEAIASLMGKGILVLNAETGYSSLNL